MKRTLPVACLLAALPVAVGSILLFPSHADAQQTKKPIVLRVDGGAPPAAPPPATPPPAAPVDAGAPAADAGVKEKGKEGADQAKRRKDHIDLINRQIRAVVRTDGAVTAEEKELIRTYWRRSMRAFRIRMLAEDEKDNATVARTDAFIAKIQKNLFDRLTEINKKPGAKPADGGAK